MTKHVHDELFEVAELVTALLACGEYERLATLSGGVRLSEEAIKEAVASYGGTLVPLPLSAKALLDVVPVASSSDQRWSLTQPLFSVEEGRSDLSLLLTVVREASGRLRFEVDDIRVL